MYIENYSTENIVNRMAKNTGWIIFGHLLNTAIGLITVTYLARYLGSEGFGKYSFVYAYLWFFGIITDLGINTILVRDISRDRAGAAIFIGNVIIIKLLLSILTIFLSCLIIVYLKSSSEIRTLVFIGALGFIFSFGSVYRVIFQASLNMFYPTAINILDSIVKFILFMWLVAIRASLAKFVFATVVYILPGLFAIIYFSARFVKPVFKVNFALWRNLLKESWPLVFTAVFIIIYTRIDQLMLFHMKGAREVGYYAAAVRVVEIFTVIPAAFLTSVFPLMSTYFKTSRESLKLIYRLSFKYMLSIILPIAVGVSLLSKQITVILYGKEFLPSVSALTILIWSEVFVFYGIVNQSILVSANKQKIDLMFTSVAAATNIVLNFILIPNYGIAGASIATVVSYSLGGGAITGFFLSSTRAYNVTAWKTMARPLIASSVMAIFVYFLRPIPLMAVFGGALVFCAVMFFLRGIDQEDIRLIKAVFRKEKSQDLYTNL